MKVWAVFVNYGIDYENPALVDICATEDIAKRELAKLGSDPYGGIEEFELTET